MTEALLPTSVSPSTRHLWRSARGPLLAAAVLVLVGLALAVVRSDDRHGRLDPRSARPNGSRAVAELLSERGVEVTIVTSTSDAAAAAGPHTTLLVAEPNLLNRHQGQTLHEVMTRSAGRTVLLAPGPRSTEVLAPDVNVSTSTGVSARDPECDLPAARQAGDVELGGLGYEASVADSDRCYPGDGLPSLLRLASGDTGGDTVLLGSPRLLYNERLAHHGNASLALQLLGSRPHLVWYLPSPGDSAAEPGHRSFYDLIPDGWRWAVLQLGVAATLTALWRARRLGPLVPERLPVTVPASEATEGRARLYHRFGARDRAAEAMRTAARTRLAPLVGVPPARAHAPQDLSPVIAAHTGDDEATVDALLFGGPPPDDASLVRLADELDQLEHRVAPPRDKDRTS